MEQFNRVIGNVGKYKVVDLFPYKIKSRENFYFRDHIPVKRDNEAEAIEYAQETARRIVEGHWLNDEGTWFWLMPKLYYYVNTGTVLIENEKKSKFPDFPHLRDNELIFFSYLLCCDSFSGFEDDPDYTCNLGVKLIEEGAELSASEIGGLSKYCLKPNREYKKYIDPWEYITYVYTVGNPRGYPLGRALYENDTYNGLTIGSRGVGKTSCFAGGDCAHEYITNGVKVYEDLQHSPRSLQFVGSSASQFIKSFMEPLQLSIEGFPGKGFKGHPLFEIKSSGNWSGDAGIIEQKTRLEDQSYRGSESSITRSVLLTNKAENVVSKRYRRIFIDEVGLQDNIEEIVEAGRGSLTSNVGRYGGFQLSGTGGNVEKIHSTKKLFRHPKLYDIFSIPDYWGDKTPMGLFVPASYKDDKHKDPQGNTDLIRATQAIVAEREEKGRENEITKTRLNFPLDPTEPFLAGKSDFFDKDAIIERIAALEHNDLGKSMSDIYDLVLGKPAGQGYEVIAQKVNHRWENAITDILTESKTGELIVYEPPMQHDTEFAEFDCLYKVTYDLVSDKDTGSSQAAIIVWKGKPKRNLAPGELINNIVAVFKGRRGEDGEGVHRLFMLLCLWYKCKGQYENTVSGLRAYFKKHGLLWILQPPPWGAIGKTVKNSTYRESSGTPMPDPIKRAAFKTFVKFIDDWVYQDELGTKLKQCSVLWDLALLYELNYFDPEKNADIISACLILMLWLEEEYMPADSALNTETKPEDSWDGLADEARRILNI